MAVGGGDHVPLRTASACSAARPLLLLPKGVCLPPPPPMLALVVFRLLLSVRHRAREFMDATVLVRDSASSGPMEGGGVGDSGADVGLADDGVHADADAGAGVGADADKDTRDCCLMYASNDCARDRGISVACHATGAGPSSEPGGASGAITGIESDRLA